MKNRKSVLDLQQHKDTIVESIVAAALCKLGDWQVNFEKAGMSEAYCNLQARLNNSIRDLYAVEVERKTKKLLHPTELTAAGLLNNDKKARNDLFNNIKLMLDEMDGISAEPGQRPINY